MPPGENLLVGLVALALVPLIGHRVLRGVRTGRLPIYRTYLDRDRDQTKFRTLMALHIASMLLVAYIAVDLLLGFSDRD